MEHYIYTDLAINVQGHGITQNWKEQISKYIRAPLENIIQFAMFLFKGFLFNICTATNINFRASSYSRIHFNIILHTLKGKLPWATG